MRRKADRVDKQEAWFEEKKRKIETDTARELEQMRQEAEKEMQLIKDQTDADIEVWKKECDMK